MTTEPVEREEWVLARRVLEDPTFLPPPETLDLLAAEVLRLRELAEVKYELLFSDRGRDVMEHLGPRIDKLYMALNARRRGDDTDLDGDPAEPWNRLVGALAHSLTHWLANARWAVAEHREADRLRALVGEEPTTVPPGAVGGKP